MGFMVRKSCPEPSLKLHLWLEMQSLYQRRENLGFNLVNRARTMSKLVFKSFAVINLRGVLTNKTTVLYMFYRHANVQRT